MHDLPQVLKAENIASFLQVSKRYAYELMQRNDFPTLKIGRSKRVYRDEFLKWLEKQKIS